MVFYTTKLAPSPHLTIPQSQELEEAHERAMVWLIPRRGREGVALGVTQKQKFCSTNLILLVNLCSAWHIVGNNYVLRK